MNFDKQYKRGRQKEMEIAGVLRAAQFVVITMTHDVKDARKDMCVTPPWKDAPVFRIEVKNEDEKANTGNLAVEVRQVVNDRGQRVWGPSGICLSEATLTIHTFGEVVGVYRTQPMRYWLSRRLDDRHPLDVGGCGNPPFEDALVAEESNNRYGEKTNKVVLVKRPPPRNMNDLAITRLCDWYWECDINELAGLPCWNV